MEEGHLGFHEVEDMVSFTQHDFGMYSYLSVNPALCVRTRETITISASCPSQKLMICRWERKWIKWEVGFGLNSPWNASTVSTLTVMDKLASSLLMSYTWALYGVMTIIEASALATTLLISGSFFRRFLTLPTSKWFFEDCPTIRKGNCQEHVETKRPNDSRRRSLLCHKEHLRISWRTRLLASCSAANCSL